MAVPNEHFIKNVSIVLPDQIQSRVNIVIEGGRFADISLSQVTGERNASANTYIQCHHFSEDIIALPGFIDTHIHGIGNADVMDGTETALRTICQQLPATGTTAFLATTLSAKVADIDRALKNVADYRTAMITAEAEILGVHLEGPFIAKDYCGAHDPDLIIPAEKSLISAWQELANQNIKMITVAAECCDNIDDFFSHCKQLGMMTALGHSGANLIQTTQAIEAGARHITHLFNAMGAKHHRDDNLMPADLRDSDKIPAIAYLAMQDPRVLVEMIVDHLHLHANTVNSVFQVKGAEGIVLITDAMRATCCGHGHYQLGGQDVVVNQQGARLKDGTLAGSILTMQSAIKNMQQATNCSLMDIAKMTAENPAKQCGVFDRKGSIAIGKDADLVLMDRDYNLIATFCRGVLKTSCKK